MRHIYNVVLEFLCLWLQMRRHQLFAHVTFTLMNNLYLNQLNMPPAKATPILTQISTEIFEETFVTMDE